MKKILGVLLTAIVVASFLVTGAVNAADGEGKGRHGGGTPGGDLGLVEDFRGNATLLEKVLPAQSPEELGITQLTFSNGVDAIHPMFSPDGSKIAYMLESSGTRPKEIHVMELIYWGNTTIVVDDYAVTNATVQCAHLEGWSPDGTKILFRSDDPDGPNRNNLWLVAADGSSAPQQLTFEDTEDACFGGPTLFQASFSPDGSKILYTLGHNNYDKDIYVMDSDGTDATQLTNAGDCELSPRWSPDGSQILYKSCPRPSDLWVMDADGTDQHVVVADVSAQFFDWSPDGQWIVYEYENDYSPSGYRRDIYKVRPDGSENTRLTPSDDYCEHTPLWGPDGTILYRSDELRVTEVTDISSDWMMRADGTEKTMINPWGGMWHDWSPDGAWIAFQTCEIPDTGGNAEIFIVANPLEIRAVPAGPNVPTTGQWGAMAMTVVLGASIVYILRRRMAGSLR